MKNMRFTVVIPTYQRRDIVANSVSALAKQDLNEEFEVIVVVDGSNDGSAKALRNLKLSFPLAVLEQRNSGASVARNRGASVARGEILMFLDDDMEAHPQLLAEHDKSLNEGADVVLGNIPIHPDSPDNLLTQGYKQWAEDRNRRCSETKLIPIKELLVGQISVRGEIFHSVGGFDTSFAGRGGYGNEDLDFCYRLQQRGYRIVYNPGAISWQKYVVSAREYLSHRHKSGVADVAFVRKHPEQTEALVSSRMPTGLTRWIWPSISTLPWISRILAEGLGWFVIGHVEHGKKDRVTSRLYFGVASLEYWRGIYEAGGLPKLRPLRVLAYHAIADIESPRWFIRYCVPPDEFCHQLDTLEKAGYHFVDTDELLRYLNERAGLPRRSLLLTFDDGYQDLLTVVMPILRQRGIPAAAFAVSGYLGGTNEWDQAKGAPKLGLLDANGLRELSTHNVEIGAHSNTHRPLTGVPTEQLYEEIAGSVARLEAAGLPRPRLYSYPHGEEDDRVRNAAKAAGLKAAFSVDPGFARVGQDPFRIPRIEIFRGDTGLRLRWKLASVRLRFVHIFKS